MSYNEIELVFVYVNKFNVFCIRPSNTDFIFALLLINETATQKNVEIEENKKLFITTRDWRGLRESLRIILSLAYLMVLFYILKNAGLIKVGRWSPFWQSEFFQTFFFAINFRSDIFFKGGGGGIYQPYAMGKSYVLGCELQAQ